MKIAKSILYGGILVGVFLLEGCYLLTAYQEKKFQIQTCTQENESINHRLEILESRLATHQESQLTLSRLEHEEAALLKRIPEEAYTSESMYMVLSFFKATPCIELQLKPIDDQWIEDLLEPVYTQAYEISFISTYTDSKNILEQLNRMYQVANVESFQFNTEVQFKEGERYEAYHGYFGEAIEEVGQTKLQLRLFYRSKGADTAAYYFSEDVMRRSVTPFKAPAVENKTIEKVSSEKAIVSDLQSDAQFIINIGDELTAGDTYKLSGPGEDQSHYIGLTSSRDIELGVEVYERFYKLWIKDQEGNIKESTVEQAIKKPQLSIISARRALREVIPHVKITLINETQEAMKVELKGNLLEQIHLYDRSGEELSKGTSKEKIFLQ